MNRRGLFKLFGAMVAGVAIDQAIPLGRVWSFPTNIVVQKSPEILPPSLAGFATIYYDPAALERLKGNLRFAETLRELPVSKGGLINLVAA